MRRFPFLVCLFGLAIAVPACQKGPRSHDSLDQLRAKVAEKTRFEVARMLGEPDTCERPIDGAEPCTWFYYTFLSGNQYAPELRGQVVHLKITFENPAGPGDKTTNHDRWRASGPLSVGPVTPTQREGAEDESGR
jgi:hypothetical protein